ncbi:uncharacterized protein LOC141910352 [Tubulanus polymorphus]|uniref:uncharacterized protein LOC141910352 n=1 Tax=Tubulanus polymorphus TaxID=672921 RepID=UPI003DA3EE35
MGISQQMETQTDQKCSKGRERKVSIRRRKISAVNNIPVIVEYGNRDLEYAAIGARILADKCLVSAIETLQDRLRLLQLKYDDCAELVNKRRERHRRRKIKERIKKTFITITWLFWLLSALTIFAKLIVVIFV